MKRLLFLLLLLPVFVEGQIITTVAGNGIAGDTGDGGPALAASLNVPYGGTFDIYGNYYFVEAAANRVRKVSEDGIISAFAGTGVAGFSGDGGSASSAKLNTPVNVASDVWGNVYIADENNNRIRKVDTNGIIHTIAGNGILGSTGDGGLATAASIYAPNGVCVDLIGNVYEAEGSRVRKIDTSGIINTIVGNGIYGFGGDGGPANSAEIRASRVYVDTIGNLFICDFLRVRKIDAATNLINSIAGTGISGVYNGDGIPADSANINDVALAWDQVGNLFIADLGNNRVRKIDAAGIINTVAGNGVAGYSGDGGPADSAAIYDPSGIAFDRCGNLYITSKQNFRIRKVTFDSACGQSSTLSVESVVPNHIAIYPNPTTTSLTITSPTNINSISLTNLLGQTVYTNQSIPMAIGVTKVEVDVSTLPVGMYLVRINGEVVRRFVKE